MPPKGSKKAPASTTTQSTDYGSSIDLASGEFATLSMEEEESDAGWQVQGGRGRRTRSKSQAKEAPVVQVPNTQPVTPATVRPAPQARKRTQTSRANSVDRSQQPDSEDDGVIQEAPKKAAAKRPDPNSLRVDKILKYMARSDENNKEQKKMMEALQQQVKDLENVVQNLRREMAEKNDLHEQRVEDLQIIIRSLQTSVTTPSPSFASVVSSPSRQLASETNVHRPAVAQAIVPREPAAPFRDTSWRCDVDISQAESKPSPSAVRKRVEDKIRKLEGHHDYSAQAAFSIGPGKVRILCKDEEDCKRVRDALEATRQAGERVLREQLYPVRVDRVKRTSILDSNNLVRPEARQFLSEDNSVEIAKVSWLSKRDSHNAYGSMVVYTTKGEDARKLLFGQYMTVGSESSVTAFFEKRDLEGPIRCYKCQVIGHKAYNCTGSERCGYCAETGHSHTKCIARIPKCCNCGGPYATLSRNCPPAVPQ